MSYSALTWRLFETAAHAGVLEGEGTRRGSAGSRKGGTWVQFDVQLDAAPVAPAAPAAPAPRATLCAARFQALGCPHVIAVADWIAAQAPGWAVRRALPESLDALQRRFDVPVEKRGRLLVVEDAWMAAMTAAEA